MFLKVENIKSKTFDIYCFFKCKIFATLKRKAKIGKNATLVDFLSFYRIYMYLNRKKTKIWSNANNIVEIEETVLVRQWYISGHRVHKQKICIWGFLFKKIT